MYIVYKDEGCNCGGASLIDIVVYARRISKYLEEKYDKRSRE